MSFRRLIPLFFMLIFFALFLTGCWRNVRLVYIVHLLPKEGEVLRDVTLYLPFPAEDGKLVENVFQRMEAEYKEYVKDEIPNVTFKPIKTAYGEMVKIHIPLLRKELDVGGELNFIEPPFRKHSQDRFVLNPKLKRDSGKNFTYIYAKYRGGSGFTLGLRYDVSYNETFLIQAGAEKITLVGVEKPPERLGFGPVPIEINEQGWIKLPILD